MAFEALNHAGSMDVDMLVILNDNDMSISENVGAFSNYFARVLSGKVYATLRKGGKKVLSRMPTVWELARRSEEHMKGMVLPGTISRRWASTTSGPVDGHDLKALIATLKNLRDLKGPAVPAHHHAQGQGLRARRSGSDQVARSRPVRSEERRHLQGEASGPSYSQIFGQWLCDMAEQDPRIVGITPAMREGSGLVEFSKRFRDRYFDVAIAEQHAVTLARGMACEGLRPVVAIYSTFLQRAYDQLIHDVALQNLPVTFAIDRAGLVGGDGATHQGSYDLSYLRCIPNLVVMAPADENECRQMLFTASQLDQPAAVRYPRGQGPGVAIESAMRALACRQRPAATRRAQRTGDFRSRRDGAGLRAHRRTTGCNARQPAVHQAARRGADPADRGFASRASDDRRECRGRRRRQRDQRMPRSERPFHADAQPRHSRPVHRARLARGLPCGRRPRPRVRRSRHRALVAGREAVGGRRLVSRWACLILARPH
jgi:1-deoxy-D-xylulose-5-phosphate synthase